MEIIRRENPVWCAECHNTYVVVLGNGESIPCWRHGPPIVVTTPGVEDPWAKPENYPGHPAYDPFRDTPKEKA